MIRRLINWWFGTPCRLGCGQRLHTVEHAAYHEFLNHAGDE